jgi:hypothetical protein
MEDDVVMNNIESLLGLGKWKIIDNQREQILEYEYDTEKEANDDMRDMIAEAKLQNESYDYDIAFFKNEQINTNYEEYMDYLDSWDNWE